VAAYDSLVRTGRTAVMAAAATALILALTACSSSEKKPADSDATSKPAASAPTTITAPDPGAAAVAAYRAFWQAYLAAADPMSPEDPRLAEHATGEELGTVRKAFLAYKAAGQVIRGTLDLAPKAVSVMVDIVLVRDCYDDQTGVYSVATGARQDQENPQRHLVTATVVNESGTWKVAAIKFEGDGCTGT
jgi:hypothetical protein